MPYVQKPVAFDSINFLPGFPSLSKYSCNPWDTSHIAGACQDGPINISREPLPMPASAYVQRAMLQVGLGPGELRRMMARGVVPAALSGIVHQLRGLGASGGSYGSDADDELSNFGPTRLGSSGGSLLEGLGFESAGGPAVQHCDCHGSGDGGTCGCGTRLGSSGSGAASLGLFDLTALTSNPLQWLQDNALPLALGAGAAWVIFRRR